ncbi:MAG: ABC transporter permease [Pseudorhodoplanes sp.]
MSPVFNLILRRLLIGLITLWVVVTLIFFAVDLLPGDLSQNLLGQEATPEAIEALRRQLGLDRPLLVRYFEWANNILHGDLGKSLASGREITELLSSRLANTIFLASFAAILAVPFSIFLGVLAALYRDRAYDKVVNFTTLTTMSFPDFFVAYVLIAFASTKLHLFPSMSMVDPSTPFWERVYRCTLPALTLTMLSAAHLMRMTRASIINLLASPYIEMAHLKGLKRARVIVGHALPNAIGPIVNVVAFNLAWLVVGIVIVEVVFTYPGLGQLLVDSVTKRDVPVVQACCLIFATTYILLNLLADLIAMASNPRMLYPR